MKAEGRSIIHMEFGQPSTGAPAAAIARAHQVLDADAMGYWESPDLRVRDLGFSRDGYAARARVLFKALGLASLDGQPASLLGELASANADATGAAIGP